jgi:hypothetical protein
LFTGYPYHPGFAPPGFPFVPVEALPRFGGFPGAVGFAQAPFRPPPDDDDRLADFPVRRGTAFASVLGEHRDFPAVLAPPERSASGPAGFGGVLAEDGEGRGFPGVLAEAECSDAPLPREAIHRTQSGPALRPPEPAHGPRPVPFNELEQKRQSEPPEGPAAAARRKFAPKLISAGFYLSRTPIPDFAQAIRPQRAAHYSRRVS